MLYKHQPSTIRTPKTCVCSSMMEPQNLKLQSCNWLLCKALPPASKHVCNIEQLSSAALNSFHLNMHYLKLHHHQSISTHPSLQTRPITKIILSTTQSLTLLSLSPPAPSLLQCQSPHSQDHVLFTNLTPLPLPIFFSSACLYGA